MEDIISKIKLSLGEVLGMNDTTSITENTSLSKDLDLDSSLFIQLLMAMEDNVPGLIFDPETLRKEDFANVRSLAQYIINSQMVAV